MANEKKEGNSIFNDSDFSLFDEIVEELENDTEKEESQEEDTEEVETPEVDENVAEEEDEDQSNAEESEDKDESEEDKSEESEEESSEEESSLFTPYANFLVDEGVLPNLNLEEFDGTKESLLKAQVSELENWKEQYKSQMPAEVKRLVDGYEKGVPFDEMLKITSDIVKYENIKDDVLASDVGLQKKLVREYLDQTTKLPDKMKDKMIVQWEDLLELEDQSKMALDELKGIQVQREQDIISKQSADREAFQNQQLENLKNLKKQITDTKEIIPDLPLSPKMKQAIENNLTKPIDVDQYGNPINKIGKYMMDNPIKGDIILNYLFEATNGFEDWSALGKSGKKKAISEFEKAAKKLDNGNYKGSRKSKRGKTSDPISGIESFLGF